ncbi:MAG: diguanylate cyclase [Desulfobulbaceae bacterium]|nr:diguanylate cyclase [Desulfobulbaceae bacterium]
MRPDHSEENSSKTIEAKKKSPGLRSFVREFLTSLHPRQWTLKTRLLYLPGFLIVLFVVLLLFYLNQAFSVQYRHSARNQLSLLSEWITSNISDQRENLQKECLFAADNHEISAAFAAEDRDELKKLLLQNLEKRLKYSGGNDHYNYHFYLPPAVSFYQNSMAGHEEDLSESESLAAKVNRDLQTYTALKRDVNGLSMVAVAPIFFNGKHVGALEVRENFKNTLESINVALPFGMLLVAETGRTAPDVEPDPEINGRKILLSKGHIQSKLLNKDLYLLTDPTKSGSYLSKTVELNDINNTLLGRIVLVYDAESDIGIYHKNIFSFLLIFGSILLILILYSNLNNISSFFSVLKKILIDSFSNDFVKRFESDHIHCLHVLNCKHNECPVHQNPSLVCYLETGSLAISPKWRNTCIFLNKYKNCTSCPVYSKRIRDELNEMRNVVNTMMHLWSNFLHRIETLLADADVLRSFSYQHKKLSLDNVSAFLEQMAKVTNFGRDLQGARNEEEVYQQLAYVLEKEFSVDYYLLLGVNRRDNTMRVLIENRNVESLCITEVHVNADLCRAKRVGEVVYSYNNNMLCPYFNIDHEEYHRYCIPMVMGGSVGVILSFMAPKKQLEARKKQITLMRKYLEESAPILNSLRLLKLLRNQTLKDPLTQCYNRRFLEDYINQYEPLAKRNKSEIGLIIMDLDFFKLVNDEYGHQAGDQILKEVVDIVRAQIRESDLLVRFGGEEFLVILLEVKDGDSSESVAEKIRTAVERHHFKLSDGLVIKKTVSLGVSVFPEDGDSITQAIKYADVALYQAKQTGRNKVLRFKPEMWHEWYKAVKEEGLGHEHARDMSLDSINSSGQPRPLGD